MNKPFTIRALRVLTFIQLAAIIFLILFIAYAAKVTPEPGSAAAGFRDGFLSAMRYDPSSFGAYQAGKIVGGQLFSLVLVILLLRFITRKNLTGIRITSVAQLLVSFLAGGVIVIQLLLVILAFLRGTREYCETADEAEVINAQHLD